MPTPSSPPPVSADFEARMRALEMSSVEMRTEFRAVRGQVAEIHKAIVNGGNGLGVRVDRLEQAEKRRAKLVSTAVGAAVAAVVGSVWTFVKTGGLR